MERPVKAVIFGCSGLSLTPDEKELFRQENPLGLIIFDRNIQTPDQVRLLTESFRKCVGRPDAPVLIDQEGGRVQRLKPPYWRDLPFAKTYGDLFNTHPDQAIMALKSHAKALAQDLSSVGITVDCWPCLDIETPMITHVMAGRCFSNNPEIVSILGQTAVDACLHFGLMPVVKHIPGYGRAVVDPHHDLPVVHTPLSTLEQTDFYPFKQVKIQAWGMIAHVIYTALDAHLPATLSKTVLNHVRNNIGFQGFLISDDMRMGALAAFGSHPELAQQAVEAGCDAVLYCDGSVDQMAQVANALPALSTQSLSRLYQMEK